MLTISLLLILCLSVIVSAKKPSGPFMQKFTTVTSIVSTIPGNGDVNPYGIAVIPVSSGDLIKGNILVSNFNNGANLQGQGTTIVQITPDGQISTFATISAQSLSFPCPGGIGLTTALAVLKRGWVIVGSLPTTGTTPTLSGAGCLIILDNKGNPVSTIEGTNSKINGPWDMTSIDKTSQAILFVANVLNGNVANGGGTIVNAGSIERLEFDIPPCCNSVVPTLKMVTTIGSGFAEKTDPAALILGPTGVGFDPKMGVVYVADTINSRILKITDALKRTDSAGTGMVVTSGGHLNQPLGLIVAPNGDIVTVNAGDGFAVETTPKGKQDWTFLLVPNGGGALFNLALVPGDKGIYFVNDNANTFMILH